MLKMKNSYLKWTSLAMLCLLIAFVTSCGNSSREENAGEEMEMMDEMEGMDMPQHENSEMAVNMEDEPAFLVDYINIKDAMVNDNFEQVKQETKDLQNSLEAAELNEDKRAELNEVLRQLGEAEDIEAQRQAFAQLSQELYELVQKENLTEKALYWQHCPMALNGEGANWLSYEEQVSNPFMGQRMPGCGSVVETINQ